MLIRLLVRVLLVPLGYFAAVIAGLFVVAAGSWQLGSALLSTDSQMFAYGFFGALVVAPFAFFMLLGTMWLPALIGILISEAFAIRSWIFHALAGAVTAWLGWQTLFDFDSAALSASETRYVFGAGLAGGFVYWAIAGRTAGFWKPFYPPPVKPALPTSIGKA